MPKHKTDAPPAMQPGLFDALDEGALDIRPAFRASLTEAMRKSQCSRWQIAAEVSRLAGRDITKNTLDKATSHEYDHGLRAEDMPAICAAVGTLEPLRVLARALGAEVVGPEDAHVVTLVRLRLEREALNTQIEALERRAK